MAVFTILPSLAAPLFEGWEETMLWSCLEGLMGEVQADSPSAPRSVRALVGDFCFLAGEPSPELVRWPEGRTAPCLLMVPRTPDWAPFIEAAFPGRCRAVSRYAFDKDPSVFDLARLKTLTRAVPEGYSLRRIDSTLYRQALAEDWSRDLVSLFQDWEDYRLHGLGVAALFGEELVCGASSYSYYSRGYEIEIDTREDHRRRGLARACAAAFILESLRLGRYPSWDAATPISAALAVQLGYRPAGAYLTYEVHPL